MNEHELAMLAAINAARARRGVRVLAADEQLAAAAAGHAADLRDNPALIQSGEYHTGSDGSSIGERIARAGYVATRYGEVTAWGWGGAVAQALMWWLNSPGHVGYILATDVVDVGVGFAAGGAWGGYWCVNTGRRAAAAPGPEPERPYTSHVPIVVGGAAPAPAVPPGAIDLLRFKLADPDCWRVVRHPSGAQEDVQDMELGGGLFVRRKGGNGEWHRYDDHYFYLVHDTSPAPGEEGVERVYTLYKDGVPGAPKSKRFQAVGEEWRESGLHRVQFRARHGCRPLAENSGMAQNHSVIVHRIYNYTFNSYGQGLHFDEVVWERTGVETQIYGRKDGRSCGWIGWAAPWGSSEPVEVHWGRGRLTVEPDRCCGF